MPRSSALTISPGGTGLASTELASTGLAKLKLPIAGRAASPALFHRARKTALGKFPPLPKPPATPSRNRDTSWQDEGSRPVPTHLSASSRRQIPRAQETADVAASSGHARHRP